MRGGRFSSAVNLFQNVHRQSMESDFAARARANAARTEWNMKHAKPSGELGDSRLADENDIKDAGLYDPRGLFIGAHKGRMLFWNRDESLLTYLRTGGGKGISLIQSVLAHIRDRTLIVTDVKNGELAWSSRTHRENTLGISSLYINPYELHGYENTRINPLNRVIEAALSARGFDGEAEQIAHILLPAANNAGGDNAWVRKGAIELLCLRIEFLAMFDPDHCTLPDLWRFLNGNQAHFAMSFSLMATCGHEAPFAPHSFSMNLQICQKSAGYCGRCGYIVRLGFNTGSSPKAVTA